MSTLDEWIKEVNQAMENKIAKKINDMLYKEYCAGTYHVSGYTRDDGVKVDDYWRTCGASHNGMNPNAGKITSGVSNIKIEPTFAEQLGNIIPKVGSDLDSFKEGFIGINYKENSLYKDAKDCMNISILGPENIINNSEFKVLEDGNAKDLSSEIGINLNNGFKTVKFDKNSSLAKNVNNSFELKVQLEQNLDKLKNGEAVQVSFNQDANLFRSLHNATIVNPKIENGILKGYLYDFYDFEYNYSYYNYSNFDSYKKNSKITIANNFATLFQDTGVIKNYNIVVPIEIKLKR